MKIYITNLPRCQDRREHMLKECARFELEAEIFPGVEGANLTETELRELVFDLDRSKFSKGEIGATLCHLGIYRDMIEKNIPVALVLEDDSVFAIDPRPCLDALERQTTEAPEVFLLTHRKKNRYIAHARLRRQAGDIQFYRIWDGHGANGYVITKKAAANILSFQTPIKGVCDWWRLFQSNDLIQIYVCEKEFIALHPELASASLVEDGRKASSGGAKNSYPLWIRKKRPLRLKVKYFFFRLRYGPNLRCQ